MPVSLRFVVGHTDCALANFSMSEVVENFRRAGVPRSAFGDQDLRGWFSLLKGETDPAVVLQALEKIIQEHERDYPDLPAAGILQKSSGEQDDRYQIHRIDEALLRLGALPLPAGRAIDGCLLKIGLQL